MDLDDLSDHDKLTAIRDGVWEPFGLWLNEIERQMYREYNSWPDFLYQAIKDGIAEAYESRRDRADQETD